MGSASPPLLVALIGFMGAGKTTVGRILASEIGAEFLDLDELVVKEAGMPISEIFRARGEPAFRDMESERLRAVARAPGPTVLAVGGGAPLRPDNRAFFLRRARTFYLEVPFEELVRRTAGDRTRPLLAVSADDLKRLYETRLPVYESLGDRIDASGPSPGDVARRIAQALRSPPSDATTATRRQGPGSA